MKSFFSLASKIERKSLSPFSGLFANQLSCKMCLKKVITGKTVTDTVLLLLKLVRYSLTLLSIFYPPSCHPSLFPPALLATHSPTFSPSTSHHDSFSISPPVLLILLNLLFLLLRVQILLFIQLFFIVFLVLELLDLFLFHPILFILLLFLMFLLLLIPFQMLLFVLLLIYILLFLFFLLSMLLFIGKWMPISQSLLIHFLLCLVPCKVWLLWFNFP